MLRAKLQSSNLGGAVYVRAAVNGGGPTGFTYGLDFTNQTDAEKDLIAMSEGVRIVVDRKSALYLKGTVIDYRDTNEGSGFHFENPNAIRK
jgi:iron-sulfur cluster assembly protein